MIRSASLVLQCLLTTSYGWQAGPIISKKVTHLAHAPTPFEQSVSKHRRQNTSHRRHSKLDARREERETAENTRLPTEDNTSGLFSTNAISRRDAIITTMSTLGAEAGWRYAVQNAAASPLDDILPPGTLAQIDAGRAAVIPNWLSPEETRAVCDDVRQCYQEGYFNNFIYGKKKKGASSTDPVMMPSFTAKGDGPFANPAVGNYALRQNMKVKMAQVKAVLARGLRDRPTLTADAMEPTHEIEYLRYDVGGSLVRHVDERHIELKRANGSKLPLKENASRRSITWLIYLNEDWSEEDGGHLRLHERANDAASFVGARKNDLQIGWLKATTAARDDEQPVFLDPNQTGPENETCMLYTMNDKGDRRNLSRKPFANVALYLGGGDAMARKVMVDNPVDAARLHLIDAPKSLVAGLSGGSGPGPEGEDGGERIRDIVPRAGTLVMFDSVSLPHEVMRTNRERFGVQGWFHEKIYTLNDVAV